jgi:hypothetical protein
MHFLPIVLFALVFGGTEGVASDSSDKAIQDSVEFLLSVQEGADKAEWPYEGVYRVRGKGPAALTSRGRIIPMGYRVGGTSIAAMGLLRAPDMDDPRLAAIERARAFVVDATDNPNMSPEFDGGYDVRGWGYIYALRFLLAVDAAQLVSEDNARAHANAIDFYLKGIAALEIPDNGGWNYARRGPLDQTGAASPFMTAPALQALFEAKRAGVAFDPAMVDRGLAALENARAAEGHIVYSARGKTKDGAGGLPGAIGRMVAVETVRLQGGKGSVEDVRRAVEAFFEHWEELLKRKSKNGTHQGPYGVAPYYFYYAHGYAAEAIEELPKKERAKQRRRLAKLLFQVREDDGSWNDRVFPRSKAYGTSQALLVFTQPAATPARWLPAAQEESEK